MADEERLFVYLNNLRMGSLHRNPKGDGCDSDTMISIGRKVRGCLCR